MPSPVFRRSVLEFGNAIDQSREIFLAERSSKAQQNGFLMASTPLLDRRAAQPSPPPRYRSLSKPNSPQKEKANWEEGV